MTLNILMEIVGTNFSCYRKTAFLYWKWDWVVAGVWLACDEKCADGARFPFDHHLCPGDMMHYLLRWAHTWGVMVCTSQDYTVACKIHGYFVVAFMAPTSSQLVWNLFCKWFIVCRSKFNSHIYHRRPISQAPECWRRLDRLDTVAVKKRWPG